MYITYIYTVYIYITSLSDTLFGLGVRGLPRFGNLAVKHVDAWDVESQELVYATVPKM